ncbi:hypothetical protein UA31_00530 [Photobacterium angustum]|nr:hypothetical protein [Photobacterium angustum]KJF83123.1 hypothetical protein UB36_00530 [Photobacterium damselae subsp. damselae]KJG47433.1 hypothetical protein UA31_00530 [Photobacterium angustum]KJG53593.1 hypothetical protein UA34_04505 [Photobacterium angustum]
MKNLSFHEKNMEKIHIVNGYWMLKFPSDTDLMKKLEWINEQDDIIKAEIEIMNNMNQPR